MRKELVERTFMLFNELSIKDQEKEVEKAHNSDILVQWYFDLENVFFNHVIDDLKKEYDIDFDIEFFQNTTDIKSLKFQDDEDLLKLNYNEFYDELLKIIDAYDFLLKGELDQGYDDFVINYFIENEVEFLVSEKVVESA
jgi:hypothetical protein